MWDIGRDLINVHKFLKAVCQGDSQTLWIVTQWQTKAMGTKWNRTGCFWTSGNTFFFFFPLSMNEHWHRLLKKGVESPFVKGHKEMVPGNYLRVTLLEQGGGIRWLLDVPWNLSHSLIPYQSQNHWCMHLKVSEELAYKWKQMKERWHWRKTFLWNTTECTNTHIFNQY